MSCHVYIVVKGVREETITKCDDSMWNIKLK